MSDPTLSSTKSGFLQDDNGDNSSGILNATVVIMLGVLTVIVGLAIIFFQAFGSAKDVNTAVLFTAGPSIITLGLSYLGYHKTQETKQILGGQNVGSETIGPSSNSGQDSGR